MSVFLEIVFWTSIFLMSYTYFVYPLLLIAIRLGRKSPPFQPKLETTPSVTVVVSVYNEETLLEERIKNLLTIRYPADKIDYLVASDGSTDRTGEILQNLASQKLTPVLFTKRRGKAAVLNDLISGANGEIVVLSDANTFFQIDTIENLIRSFADSRVGAVCGELRLQAEEGTIGGFGENAYWNYENWLKKLESDIYTTLGATGAVYAIRKALFTPLPLTKAVTDDFLIPIIILKKGYRIKYAPNAIAFEKSTNSVVSEFKRKSRIGAANFNGISEYSSLLHPRNGFVSLALWSRKLIRWFVPFLFFFAFFASLAQAGQSGFFLFLSLAEISFLAVALFGFALDKAKVKTGVFGLPYYFCAMNLALMVGFVRFVLGRQRPTWDVVR